MFCAALVILMKLVSAKRSPEITSNKVYEKLKKIEEMGHNFSMYCQRPKSSEISGPNRNIIVTTHGRETFFRIAHRSVY